MCLTSARPKTGAALGAALLHIDPIETLGKPRQMLGRDAGAVVAHRHQHLLAIGHSGGREADIDAFAGGAVFERVLDQVLEHARELIAVARHDGGLRPAAR